MDRGNSTPYEENSASPAQPSALHLAPPSALPALPSGGSYVTMAAECEGKGGKNMGRDMAKKAITDLRSQQKVYKQLNMKIRKDSGIFEALYENEKKTGIAPATYAQRALREKLIADGYLSPSNEPEE